MPLQNIEDWDPILKANAASMLIIEGPAEAGAKLTYDVDLGLKPLDRERMKQQARAGENWYMSVLKLVFSYVNGGLSDQQIHEQTEPLTLADYTSQQTAADVQKMIKSARVKIRIENELVPQLQGSMDGIQKNQDCPGPDRLVKTSKGHVPANLHNIFTVLNEFSPWGQVFAYDDFTMRKMIITKPPNQTGNPSHFTPREIRDTDYAKVTRWLNRNGFLILPKQVVCDAVNEISELNIISPVRYYLESLSFDPMIDEPLLSVWMERFLGVLPENTQETDYVRAVSRLSLIQAVARTLNPGCKADSVPILEGEQGTGKSTALRVLHGTEWFGDALPPMGTKDASDYVRGKWGIELAELAFQAKAEVEAQKAYISRQEERFRPAYGREEITYERRCVFWGTTNRIDYLKDETGNRRFLPVQTGKIDITGLKDNRDKLWAEAVYYFQKKERYWLNDDMLPFAKKQAHRRLESDPWTQDVITSLSDMKETTIREALMKCFPQDPDGQGIRSHQITQKMNRRMGNCLIAAGWSHDGKYTSGPNRNQVRYIKFDDASDTASDDMKNDLFKH
jgi:predicted P-loop ATPase